MAIVLSPNTTLIRIDNGVPIVLKLALVFNIILRTIDNKGHLEKVPALVFNIILRGIDIDIISPDAGYAYSC